MSRKGREMLTGEAAQEFGFNATYVARLASQGKVKARKVGRDWLIDRKSMEAYIKDWQKRKPGPKRKETPE